MEPVEITAGRLHLRPWQLSDEQALTELFSDAASAAFTPSPVPFTANDARERLTVTYPAMWDAGLGPFAVLDAVSGQVLGWAGLFNAQHGRAEIGWATHPAARSQGVASQAVQVLCRWGFAHRDLEVIEALIGVANWPSLAVAQKSGFTLQGIRRKGMPQRGALLDAWELSLLRDDEVRDRRPLQSVELTDGVVTLRPFRPADAHDVQRACDDHTSAHWLPLPSPYTLADAVEYVEKVCPNGWAMGTEANFAVVDAVTGEFLGDCGLKVRDTVLGLGEVGYWTAPWARGRGVAGRAAALAARWGLTEVGLSRVDLLADVENVASLRAADRAGFVREGVARAARPDRHGQRHDMAQFSLVRRDIS